MIRRRFFGLAVLVCLYAGCSRSSETVTVVATGSSAAGAATAIAAAAEAAPQSASATDATSKSDAATPNTAVPVPAASNTVASIAPVVTPTVTDLPDINDLFAPPKALPKPQPHVAEPSPPPPPPPPAAAPIHHEDQDERPRLPELRLLGFVETDDIQILLSVDGELNMLSEGDTVKGVQLVELDPPSVTLRFLDEQVAINLYEQPWFHTATAAAGDGNRARPIHPTNTLPRTRRNTKPAPAHTGPLLGLPPSSLGGALFGLPPSTTNSEGKVIELPAAPKGPPPIAPVSGASFPPPPSGAGK